MAERRVSSTLPASVFFNPSELTDPIPDGLSAQQAFEVGMAVEASGGKHGLIARLHRKYRVPREAIVACRDRFRRIRDRLCQSEAPQWPVSIPRSHIETAIISSRASFPITFRALQLSVYFFLGVTISYGTTYSMVTMFQALAQDFLGKVRLDRVKRIALDELFFHGRCVMVVIDLESEFVCGLKVVDHLDEQAWIDFLTELRDKRGLRPDRYVSDAGTSLCPAAAQVFPWAVACRDIFHAKRDLLDLLTTFQRRAYKALKPYFAALKRRAHAHPDERREAAQQLRRTEEEADRAIFAHDSCLTLVERAFDALELVDLGDLPFQRLDDASFPPRDKDVLSPENLRTWEVRFRRGADAAAKLGEVAKALLIMKDPKARKVGRYLQNQLEPLVAYIDRLSTALISLAHNPDEQAAVLVFAALYRIDRERFSPFYAWKAQTLNALRETLVGTLEELTVDPGRLASLAQSTVEAIQTCGRASSLVECFNSVSRTYVNAGKRLSERNQILLSARWNLAQRRSGRLKGSSPYTLLTGERVEDWVAFLQKRPAPTPAPGGSHLAMVPGLPTATLTAMPGLEEFNELHDNTELAQPPCPVAVAA